MGEHLSRRVQRALLVMALVIGAAVVAASPLTAAERNSYTVTPLVSDQPGVAAHTDPNLVNAWGLASGPTTPWWVSDNGMDKSTLYRGSDGLPQALVVAVAGGPTGTVFNPTTGFVLPTGGKALFIFDSEDGKVRAWNGAQGTTAIVVKDPLGARSTRDSRSRRHAPGRSSVRDRLPQRARRRLQRRVAARHAAGRVRRPEPEAPLRAVRDPDDRLARLRHLREAGRKAGHDEIAGRGRGFVDAYDLMGTFLGRVAKRGQLNAPWGLALAPPPSFGRFGGDLLVGNFGDGQINAYEEKNGHFEHRGELRSADGGSISIDGLWALEFGNGGQQRSRRDALLHSRARRRDPRSLRLDHSGLGNLRRRRGLRLAPPPLRG